jgi:hypothetical protein
MNANDPQIEIAHNAAALLNARQSPDIFGAGNNADITVSLAPFLIVYDLNGKVLYSTGLLNGKPPVPPIGVLLSAQGKGENRITWQPTPGVRIATVVIPFKGNQTGYVLVGKSLREVESRINSIMRFVFIGWLASLASTFVLSALQQKKEFSTA